MPARTRHVLTALLCLAILPTLTCQAAGHTYRWTDAEGSLQLGDTLPSGAAERGYQVIDPSTGAVIREVEPRKTPAQKAREEAERRAAEQAREKAEVQARRDRVLLSLYASVEDIERARDERLDRIDRRIDQFTESIERLRERLSAGEAESGDALELRKLSESRARLEFEREEIHARFEREIRRFRGLKGLD